MPAQDRPSALPGLCLATLLLPGCGADEPQRTELFVFGTLVEVQVRSSDEDRAGTAFREINRRFRAMHSELHAWKPGALEDVNRAFAAGHPIEAPADLVTIVRRSAELEEASCGYFNAAIGGLVRLWGFHTSEFPVRGPPPPPTAIQAWLQRRPSTRDIDVQGHVLESANPSVRLDLGGIAKGHAVDAAVHLLAGYGFQEVLVNAGGDLRARGAAHHPWRVGIRGAHGVIVGAIRIGGDEAVFTSGTAERYLQDGEARFPHVLNPLTGRPARGLQSATVIAGEGMLADAAATALLAAGPARWCSVAASMGIAEALVIDDAGRILVTPAMDERVRWQTGIADDKIVVIVPPRAQRGGDPATACPFPGEPPPSSCDGSTGDRT